VTAVIVPNAERPSARDDHGPYLGTTFRVRISGTASTRRAAGLAVGRVAWGPFPVVQRDVPATPAFGTADGLPACHVLLSRGLTSSTDLADWWRVERAPKRSAARTVVVELIDPGSGMPLLTWTFRECRVVHLSYSPLDAQVAAVMTESLVFVYADVDIN
jgi:hypothetical protein